MSIDDHIRRLQHDLERVRPAHPSRLPSWVVAAAVAAGLSLSAGCAKESPSVDPTVREAEPPPTIALYAGPPPEAEAPPPMEAGPVTTPPMESVMTPPPPVPPYGVAQPPPPVADPVDIYGGPPMTEEPPVMKAVKRPPPPVPAYGMPMMQPTPTPPPMRLKTEPVTDYGAPFDG